MDIDLRLVRAFVAVAEHGHFGRAAEALHLAQPALSRQVRRLEGEMRVRLFDRDTRGTGLSVAGTAFLPGARALLDDAEIAVATARAAALPERLVVGYADALSVTAAVRALRESHPHADVVARYLRWDEPRSALLGHRVDVAVARLPFEIDGLTLRHVHDEPRVLLTAREHPLAQRESVRLADLAHEPLARLAGADPEFAAFWRVDPRPDGARAALGPTAETPEDRLELVAAGEAVALATGALQGGRLRPDLAVVAVEDVAPVPVVVAARDGDDRPLVTAFLHLAIDRIRPWAEDTVDPDPGLARRASKTKTP